jgi:hypothetical protein
MIKPRRMRSVVYIARMGEKGYACKILLGKPRKDDIKMELRMIECSSMDWINLARNWDQRKGLVNKVMNLRSP